MKYGDYRRFDKKIKWVNDSPEYQSLPIIEGKPIKYKKIKRYSQLLCFYPSLVFENKYLIKSFRTIREPLKKV